MEDRIVALEATVAELAERLRAMEAAAAPTAEEDHTLVDMFVLTRQADKLRALEEAVGAARTPVGVSVVDLRHILYQPEASRALWFARRLSGVGGDQVTRPSFVVLHLDQQTTAEDEASRLLTEMSAHVPVHRGLLLVTVPPGQRESARVLENAMRYRSFVCELARAPVTSLFQAAPALVVGDPDALLDALATQCRALMRVYRFLLPAT